MNATPSTNIPNHRAGRSRRRLSLPLATLLLPLAALAGPATKTSAAASEAGKSAPRETSASEASGGGNALFSEDELASLRRRARSDAYAGLWSEIVERAEAFADPGSSYYADPDDVLAEARTSRRKTLYWNAARLLGVWADTLGPAAALENEPRFGEHGAKLLLAMVDAVPLARPGILDEPGLARGEMASSLASAYIYFKPYLSAAERKRVAEYGRAYVENILAYDRILKNPHSNWRAVVASGAGYLAVALSEDYPVASQDWAGAAARLVREWMDMAFGPDGSYAEGAGYIEYAMRMVAPFAEALANQGGPELMAHPNVRAVPDYLAMKLIPGTPILDNRNDAAFPGEDTFGSAWIKRFARVNGDPLAAWLLEERGIAERRARGYALPGQGRSFRRILWHHDVAPRGPGDAGAPLANLFLEEGVALWRTGWTSADTLFSIAAGRYQVSGHDQSDEGHFNLYSHGVRWSSDPGYGNKNSKWDKGQGLAHSMVLVDGKATALSWSGRGTDGHVLDYRETDDYYYGLFDLYEAYNRNVHYTEMRRQPNKGPGKLAAVVDRARRHAVFVKPHADAAAYVVLYDDFRKDAGEHRFTWQLMTEPDLKIEERAGGLRLTPPAENGEPRARMDLYVSAARATETKFSLRDRFAPGQEGQTFRVVRVETDAANPHFVSVLLPMGAEVEAPDVRFVREDGAVAAVVEWPGHRDTLRWRAGMLARPEFRREPVEPAGAGE